MELCEAIHYFFKKLLICKDWDFFAKNLDLIKGENLLFLKAPIDFHDKNMGVWMRKSLPWPNPEIDVWTLAALLRKVALFHIETLLCFLYKSTEQQHQPTKKTLRSFKKYFISQMHFTPLNCISGKIWLNFCKGLSNEKKCLSKVYERSFKVVVQL